VSSVRRVVVVGGSGFLGSRAVSALRQLEGLEVEIASRSSARRVDVTDPATFEALRGADIVVDLADATTYPPDALAAWCLANGIVFLETTSDRLAIERLAALAEPGPGAVVLGAGIFTGISNLLARAATDTAGPGARLSLGIRTTPFSGAGKGTVALMASTLSVPGVSYDGGRRVEHPPISRGPRIEFPSGPAPSLRVPLAEQSMLHASTGARDVEVFFAPKPALLVVAFGLIPLFLARTKLFAGFMRGYFTFLRRVLLRSRTTSTEIVADAEGPNGKVHLAVTAPDGMGAGGLAIAAIVAELAERGAPPRGVHMIDDLVGLDGVIARMCALGGEGAIVTSWARRR
jgi:short subunit dehydrogenase-like uncharacterized protein